MFCILKCLFVINELSPTMSGFVYQQNYLNVILLHFTQRNYYYYRLFRRIDRKQQEHRSTRSSLIVTV
jgi:hypothetical protein